MSKLLYDDKVWTRTIHFLNTERLSWIQIRKILSDTVLTMLERTVYLAITLLSVKCRFQIHWSGGKYNA